MNKDMALFDLSMNFEVGLQTAMRGNTASRF